MTQARPKPLLGALLGFLLGGVSMALLTVLGVLPPDRLPLFGILALAVLVSAYLLTQRVALARGRFITVMVISALLGGVALAGIPEIARGGSTTTACLVTATSSMEPEPTAPSSTTAVDPFRVSTTDTVSWTTATDGAVTQADATLSLMIGGFAIPVRNATFAEGSELTQWNGDLSVESQLDSIQDSSGMLMTGTYHFAATADTDGEECSGNAYIRVEPTGAFDGLLLVLLWALMGLLLIAIVVLAIGVRRSIRESDAALAMVGTSAIPGGTSTTPPPASDRNAEDSDERSSERPAQERQDDRSARGVTTAEDDSGSGPSTGGEQSARPEEANPAEFDGPHDEDGLNRSPYASSEGDEGPSVAEDYPPLEDSAAADDVPPPVESAPVEEPMPVDDTPPLEERTEVDGAEYGGETPENETEGPRSN